MTPTAEDRRRAAAITAWFPQQGQPDDKERWRQLQQAMDDAVKAGEQGFLFALHDACAVHPMLQSWPQRSAWRAAGLIPEATALRHFLERAKTPPKSEQPWSVPARLPDGPARNLGAMLAYAQDDDLLERELEHFGLEPALRDLFACWIHERVVRGSAIARSPFVQQFHRALPSSHPLAALPLDLVPLEAGIVVTSPRRLDTLGNWLQYGDAITWDGFKAEGTWSTSFKELPVDVPALAAVAADEGLCPNSTYEAKIFALSARPPDLRALSLISFGLDCLGPYPAKVKSCDARTVMALLLMLGTGGGAYGEARSAAYGRLLAWRSLTALAGLAPGTPFAEVEARAQNTQWLSFESESEWFNHVSLDVGMVALRADDSLAVLAITDTD